MQKKFLALGILGVLLLSVTTVFALANNTPKNNDSKLATMQAMHEKMMKSVQDPALRQAMEEMHKQHMQKLENGEGMNAHSHSGIAGTHGTMACSRS